MNATYSKVMGGSKSLVLYNETVGNFSITQMVDGWIHVRQIGIEPVVAIFFNPLGIIESMVGVPENWLYSKIWRTEIFNIRELLKCRGYFTK